MTAFGSQGQSHPANYETDEIPLLDCGKHSWKAKHRQGESVRGSVGLPSDCTGPGAEGAVCGMGELGGEGMGAWVWGWGVGWGALPTEAACLPVSVCGQCSSHGKAAMQ
jgi:hypothetical protein